MMRCLEDKPPVPLKGGLRLGYIRYLKMSLSRRDKILIAPGFNPGKNIRRYNKNPVGVQYLIK